MKIVIYTFLMTVAIWSSDTVVLGNLEWQDNPQAKSTQLNWSDANKYCKELNLTSKDDWRLPNIKELQSIVDINRYNPAIKSGFKNVTSSGYWASSQSISSAKYSWNVYFKNGGTDYYSQSNEYYVRCVRYK